MAIPGFDGSGNYQRKYSWQQDAANGINILSDRHDEEDDGFAAALSNAITKDGQTQVTADIPFNGKKLVNVGTPTGPQDAATKAYVDAIRAFSTALEVSGSAAQARIKFTGTTGPWGLEFPTADLSFGVKAGVVGSSWNRFVWNEKSDLSGQDIMVLNAGDTAQLGVGLAPPIAGNSGIFSVLVTTDENYTINAYHSSADNQWHFVSPGFATLFTSSKAGGNVAIYRSTVSGAADAVIVWDNRITLHADGQVTVQNQINNGANWQTNGNIVGSVWAQLGYSDAYSAVVNRIESRCAAFQAGCVTSTRSAGYLGYSGSGGAGAYFENSAYFMSGVQKVSGDSYNMYFRQPQVHYPSLGWVAAFPW